MLFLLWLLVVSALFLTSSNAMLLVPLLSLFCSALQIAWAVPAASFSFCLFVVCFR